MDDPLDLRRECRYDLRALLVVILVDADGPLTVAQLVGLLSSAQVELPGRPSKAVSDSLRWEICKGRVVKVGHATYCAGVVPRTTLRRLRQRASAGASSATPLAESTGDRGPASRPTV